MVPEGAQVRTVKSAFGIDAQAVPWIKSARLRLLGSAGADVALVDRWRPAPRRRERVVCSVPLAQSWPQRGTLALPWHQWIKLGSLEVALGPAGSAPEACVLRARLHDLNFTSALAASSVALPGSEPADVDDTDVLLLDASAFAAQTTSDLHAALKGRFESANNATSVILVDDPRVAVAFSHWAHAHGVAARFGPGLIRHVGRFGTAGSLGWRGPLQEGEVGVWHLARRDAMPWRGECWVLAADEASADLSFSPALSRAQARRLAERSGASVVMLWASTEEQAEALDDELTGVEVLRLEGQAQLQLM